MSSKHLNFQKYLEFAKVYLDDINEIKSKIEEEIEENESFVNSIVALSKNLESEKVNKEL
jgi:hypothetical protein